MSWQRIQRTRRSSVQPKDELWSRSARRSVEIRQPDLSFQVPDSHLVKLLLLRLLILLLLISSFFVGSPFASVDLNRQTSASVAAREATGHSPAPAASGKLLQPLETARLSTDDKYRAALQRLGQDECNLVNLVTRLNDFDPVELVVV